MHCIRNIFIIVMIFIALSSGLGNAANSPKADSVTLRLNWAPSAEHAFIYLGIEKGFYKDKNIDLKVLPGEGSTVVAKLVGNKSAGFGLISGDTLVIAKSKGVPLKALAALYHETPASICSLKDKNIVSPKDLEGKKVGVVIKSTTFQQYQGMIKNAGVDRSKIKEVPVNGHPQELISGTVDALVHYTYLIPLKLRELGYEVNEINAMDYGIKIYSQAIITNDALIARKSELVHRFMDATLKSLDYSKEHPEEALASLLKYNPELDRKNQELTLKRINDFLFDKYTEKLGTGYMTKEGWTQTQNTLLNVKLIDKNIDVKQLYTNVFWEKYNKSKTIK